MALTKIKCTDGFELGAYEAIPSGDAKGAVVVIQEVFGVNSHIRSVVDVQQLHGRSSTVLGNHEAMRRREHVGLHGFGTRFQPCTFGELDRRKHLHKLVALQ